MRQNGKRPSSWTVVSIRIRIRMFVDYIRNECVMFGFGGSN